MSGPRAADLLDRTRSTVAAAAAALPAPADTPIATPEPAGQPPAAAAPVLPAPAAAPRRPAAAMQLPTGRAVRANARAARAQEKRRFTCDLNPRQGRMLAIFRAQHDHQASTLFRACIALMAEGAVYGEARSFAGAVIDRADLLYAAGREPAAAAAVDVTPAGPSRAMKTKRYTVDLEAATRRQLVIFKAEHGQNASDLFRACIELMDEDDAFADAVLERADLLVFGDYPTDGPDE